jgi:hypothetical protein
VGTCWCRLGRPPLVGVALACRWPLSSVLRWWQPEEVVSVDKTVGASCGRTPDSLALMACPRPSSGDVGEGLVTAASALRSSLLLFSCPKRGSLSLLSWVTGEPPGVCHPAGPPMWGVVRTRGSGTGVPFVRRYTGFLLEQNVTTSGT